MQTPPTRPEPTPAAAPPADDERLQLLTLGDLLHLSGDFVRLLQHEVDIYRQTPNQPREVREKTFRTLMIRFDQLSRSIFRNVLLSRTLATPRPAPDRPARPTEAAPPAPAPRAVAPKPVSQPNPIIPTREDIAASIRGAIGLAEPPATPLHRPPAANPVPLRAAFAAKFGPLPMPSQTGTGPPRPRAR